MGLSNSTYGHLIDNKWMEGILSWFFAVLIKLSSPFDIEIPAAPDPHAIFNLESAPGNSEWQYHF